MLYKDFSSLYKDYKEIIDAEFEKRHLFRLNELLTSIKNRQQYASRQISGLNFSSQNQYLYDKIDLYDEVYQCVIKELTLRIPTGDTESMIDSNIKKLKNDLVDIIFSGGDLERYRGTQFYNFVRIKASLLADLFEKSMKEAYYSSNYHSFEMVDGDFRKRVEEALNERRDKLKTEHYHDHIKGLVNVLREFSKLDDKEQEKILTKIKKDYEV